MEALPNNGIDPINKKPVKRSNTWFGWNTIYGREGEHHEPYMTRIWFGRLRIHIFYRGDNDPDPHDHPWNFWTFPLTPYVEEVVEKAPTGVMLLTMPPKPETVYRTRRQIVPSWRWSFRPSTHCHRVIGRLDKRHGIEVMNNHELRYFPDELRILEGRKIITIVWRGGEGRKWGFLKNRDGKWCWVHWKDYVFAGGKDTPCQ